MSSVKTLYVSSLLNDGKTVDYASLSKSSEFEEFKAQTTQLNDVKLDEMTETERKAFFINVYNALTIHGILSLGCGDSLFERLQFYAKVSYSIDKFVFNLNEIENGVLRENRRSPTPFTKIPFSADDPRLKFTSKCDPRIHFALNCGAKSCPPIRFYDPEKIEQQLDLATKAFVNGLELSENGKSLRLSKIFYWYRNDFGSNDREILEWIEPFVTAPEKKEAVKNQLKGKDVKCSYAPYD
eukprot:CAMPEP_0171461258 /NCGR_PEP_ID=MMETSP0945-20130129/5780_1 /TAXON_ID=109269 /ORGANISM="Vaucheria litorea, Strain CCMP2940" /LENGTH=239 /DNA_ID=CAMNT_0011987573 /DNA_START=198 /DNA_END=914 /DNA_ORIENTATION=+